MTSRAARFVTRLYPPTWRARYGEEFQTFLESRRVPPFEILNILASALSERLAGFLTVISYACPALIGAAGAMYLTASGSTVPRAFEAHRALWLCWAIIEASSLGAAALGAVAAAPVVFAVFRSERRVVLLKLVKPSLAGIVLVLLAGAAARWGWGMMAFPTLLFLGTFVESAAGFLKYFIGHTELSRSLGRPKLAVLAMAASILVTTITAAAWGRWLGFTDILTAGFSAAGLGVYVCWGVVSSMLVAAAISGVNSARRLFSGRME